MAVGPRFVARSAVLATLGLEPTAHPLGVGEYIAADPTGLADAEGGAQAARAINVDLMNDACNLPSRPAGTRLPPSPTRTRASGSPGRLPQTEAAGTAWPLAPAVASLKLGGGVVLDLGGRLVRKSLVAH